MITSNAKAGQTYLSIIEWKDSVGRGLSVSNVSAVLYFYDAGQYTTLEDNLVPIQQAENTHRYTLSVNLPADTEGQTLYLDFSATYDDDQSTLYRTERVLVGSLSQPPLRVTFS